MRILWTTLMALAATLAGCATPDEQAARMEREMDRAITINGPACERLGYQRDTDQWRNCVLRLSQQQNTDYYSRFPTSTTCFGGPGLLHCTSF